MKNILKYILLLVVTLAVTSCFVRVNRSTTVTRNSSYEALFADGTMLHVEFPAEDIVRLQYVEGDTVCDNATGVVIGSKDVVSFTHEIEGDVHILATNDLCVELNYRTAHVAVRNAADRTLLWQTTADRPFKTERVAKVNVQYDESTARVEHTANGDITVKDEISRDTVGFINRYAIHFLPQENEALYGLGAHMEDYMNLRGKTLYLTQHNLKAMVPVLTSTAGYGILFDAGCAMKYSDNENGAYMELEAANELDMYIMRGATLDDVVANYRGLTGQNPMMPRYMFGYIQSKERYVSQDDILSTLREYRNRHLPIDMIVQDWSYWPEGWGYMKMDPKHYPDPKAMADSVHSMNAKLMVSIWPNPQWCPQADDFKQRGFMLEQSVYDVFNPEARKYYWSYANNEFFSKGFDAWWCDCSEPLDGDWKNMGEGYGWDNQEQRWHLNADILSISLGEKRSSLYSLYHAMGIYENQRATSNDKRVVNLTRSSYAGQQRYATITWNGDTHASWKSFKQQIPAGLNFMATGCSYWSVDIGSFFTRGNDPWHRWFNAGEFPGGCDDPEYREYYTRMLQWGTFLPMMRSHGTDTPREVWRFGEEGTPYYDAIVKMINLRYALLPYIYSNAWRTTRHAYTMARLLAFDFPDDKAVLDIKDEYMFGDAFLVCPVTDKGATSRKVYLPKGTKWYDYWTNKLYNGGQTIDASAPIDRLPLFVKAGSIIPMGQPVEYAAQQIGKPMDIRVYPGDNATFTLYEDEGDNYNYEKGFYATTVMQWNDDDHTLTIRNREGQYKGMPSTQQFNIITPKITKMMEYDGRKKTIKL